MQALDHKIVANDAVKVYGSKEDDEDALKSLSMINISGDQSAEAFASIILENLGKPSDVFFYPVEFYRIHVRLSQSPVPNFYNVHAGWSVQYHGAVAQRFCSRWCMSIGSSASCRYPWQDLPNGFQRAFWYGNVYCNMFCLFSFQRYLFIPFCLLQVDQPLLLTSDDCPSDTLASQTDSCENASLLNVHQFMDMVCWHVIWFRVYLLGWYYFRAIWHLYLRKYLQWRVLFILNLVFGYRKLENVSAFLLLFAWVDLLSKEHLILLWGDFN